MTSLQDRIRAHPAFSTLTRDEAAALLGDGTPKAFGEGEILLREGDPSDHALFVLEGTVRVEVASRYGTVDIAALEAPALLGDIGVFAEVPRTATIRAASRGEVLRISDEGMRRLGRTNPDLMQYVVLQLGRKIQSFNQAIGFYTNALAALEDEEGAAGILEDLLNPPAELTNFGLTFGKLARQIQERRARLEEMANATAIQRAMLPQLPVAQTDQRVALDIAFRPAREVGGDFFDVVRLDEHRLALTVGDVSGKGVPASLFMAVCQTAMRLALREERDLGRAASRVNDFLDADNARSMFATFFGAVLDLRDGRLSYVNCGHNPPLLLRRGGEVVRLGGGEASPPLAAWSPFAYEQAELRLTPGDRLAAFTDGVTEAPDAEGAEFGEERLLALLSGTGAPQATAEDVVAAVDRFVGEAPQFDDLTCLLVTFRPEGS